MLAVGGNGADLAGALLSTARQFIAPLLAQLDLHIYFHYFAAIRIMIDTPNTKLMIFAVFALVDRPGFFAVDSVVYSHSFRRIIKSDISCSMSHTLGSHLLSFSKSLPSANSLRANSSRFCVEVFFRHFKRLFWRKIICVLNANKMRLMRWVIAVRHEICIRNDGNFSKPEKGSECKSRCDLCGNELFVC